MLKIRLARVGKRNSPIFRLVVAEKARAVKRENLEILGIYNPTLSSDKFQINKDRVEFWISRGAEPSVTANNLLCDFGVLPKNKKIKITFGRPKKKKEQKAAKEKAPAVPGTSTEKAEETAETPAQPARKEPKVKTEEMPKEKLTEEEKTDKENLELDSNNKEKAAQADNTEKAKE